VYEKLTKYLIFTYLWQKKFLPEFFGEQMTPLPFISCTYGQWTRALPPARNAASLPHLYTTHQPLQPVARCRLTNTNKHSNEQTNQQTNKHDRLQ